MTTSSRDKVAESFEAYRPLLFSIAYRMLGSASDAEDILQEAYLRYQNAESHEISELKAYLCAIVTNLCLDYLKSARVQREQYIGPWLPEPVLTGEQYVNPFETAERHESISQAFLVLLEELTPPERAVFLLHEVFDFDYREIGAMIGKSAANCRQLCHRAKAFIAERHHRFDTSPETHLRLITSFFQASQEGDMRGLQDILAQDVVSWADGGGKVPSAHRLISGAEKVARLWLGLARKAPATLALSIAEVNGTPAALLWLDDALYAVLTFDVLDGRIKAIRNVLNPDKLAYIGQQLQRQ
jgi:RNA polymerase sigma-70 factor (ECF subfamily)